MSKLPPEEQKKLALSKIARLREELHQQARPISDHYLAQQGAHYSGATVGQVLKWMGVTK